MGHFSRGPAPPAQFAQFSCLRFSASPHLVSEIFRFSTSRVRDFPLRTAARRKRDSPPPISVHAVRACTWIFNCAVFHSQRATGALSVPPVERETVLPAWRGGLLSASRAGRVYHRVSGADSRWIYGL